MSDANVVDFILPYIRQRATTLLNRLKTRPKVITWDKTGQMKIESETIPNSNISDSVSDAMRSRKNFNPTGAKVMSHESWHESFNTVSLPDNCMILFVLYPRALWLRKNIEYSPNMAAYVGPVALQFPIVNVPFITMFL